MDLWKILSFEKGFFCQYFPFPRTLKNKMAKAENLIHLRIRTNKSIKTDELVNFGPVKVRNIMLTCPCNIDSLTPHFYRVKLGFTGV